MFTVYGLNGRIYSGPLEGLRSLGPVQAVARLRAVEPVGLEAVPRLVLGGPNPEGGPLATTELLPRDALSAYAQNQAAAAPRQPLTEVEALMTRRVLTVPLATTVGQAQSLLAQAGVGQAPVVDANRQLVGLLLRADLLPRAADLTTADAWRAWLRRPIEGLMWTPVPSVQPDTPIRQVAQVLLDLQLPGLPVLDEAGALQGFVSRSDILQAMTKEPPLDLWS